MSTPSEGRWDSGTFHSTLWILENTRGHILDDGIQIICEGLGVSFDQNYSVGILQCILDASVTMIDERHTRWLCHPLRIKRFGKLPYTIIMLIIIITPLFEEDNIFGMNASLTWIIYSMYRAVEIYVHRACCERATQPYSLGGGGMICPASRPAGYQT